MIALKTITTIELSNICNLKCRYCINRLLVKDPVRTPGIMSDETFERALHYLRILVMNGTQDTINLNGDGESCLDPQLPQRIRMVKDITGGIMVNMCTNGVNMTPELARSIADAGIDRCDLSPHSPFHARRALRYMANAGIRGVINYGAITASHNWAGQLEPENSVPCNITNACDSLIEGRGYILTEGNVTPCCYDYRNLGAFGSVYDDDLLEQPIRTFELCGACHQRIPKYVLRKMDAEEKEVCNG